MMTVFNFVNARKLNDELNIFKGACDSLFFPVIVVAIFVLQVILVTFAGFAVGVAPMVSLPANPILRVLVSSDGSSALGSGSSAFSGDWS